MDEWSLPSDIGTYIRPSRKSVFALVAGSLGLALMLVAVLIWAVALAQATNPGFNAASMPPDQWADAYGSWLSLLNYCTAAGIAGLICCLLAFLVGHDASVDIRESRGWLSGEGAARLAQILGLTGLVVILLTFCSTASLLAYRFWVLPN